MMMTTKTIIRSLLILFFAVTVSCSKDSTTEDTNTNVLSAKVNGNLINFGGAIQDHDFDNIYVLWGWDSTCSKEMSLHISKDLENGTYLFDTDEINASYSHGDVCCFYMCDPVYQYEAIEGSITLQVFNETNIKGTFHFNAEKYI